MSSGIYIEAQKPMAIIVLDIEGILIDPSDKQTEDAVKKTMADMPNSHRKYQDVSQRYSVDIKRAAVDCFSQPAVDNLMTLIQKISKVAQVGIVLSSSWRSNHDLDELKSLIFAGAPFSDFIIDKIPDSHSTHLLAKFDGKISPKRELPSDISSRKYGFSLADDDRSKEIEFWLNENKERFQIERFVILNRYDQKIVDRYPEHFVQVHPNRLFSALDADDAYHILLKTTSVSGFLHSQESEEKESSRQPRCCTIF